MTFNYEEDSYKSDNIDDNRPKHIYSKLGSDYEPLIKSSSGSTNASSTTFSLRSYLSQIKTNNNTKEFDSLSSNFENISRLGSNNVSGVKTAHKIERMSKLERSLNGIQSNIELKRGTILENIYQKINQLENKIINGESLACERLAQMNQKVDSIEKTIELINKKHETILKDKTNTIDSICNKFNESLIVEQENWKQTERDTITVINGQINSIKEEVHDIQKAKSEIILNLKTYIDVELPQFKVKLDKMNEEIHRMEEVIVNKTSDDIIALADYIKHEDDQMNGIKNNILSEVNKEIENIKSQIRQEHDEREITQAKLITLMEETIKRLGSPL